MDDDPTQQHAWRTVSCLMLFSVALPVYDLLQANPAFFSVRQYDLVDMGWLIACVSGGAIVLSWALMRFAFCFGRRVHATVFYTTFIVCCTIMFMPVWMHDVGCSVFTAGALSCGIGGGGAVIYHRVGWARAAFQRAMWAHVVVVCWFVAVSPCSTYVTAFFQGDTAPVVAANSEHPPVVLIVFDELPLASLVDEGLHIDKKRFPNFARFADSSSWYKNAIAAADFTVAAIPSLLTGRLAHEDYTANLYHADRISAFTAGHALGYRVHALEHMTSLCPQHICHERVSLRPQRRVERLRLDLRDVGYMFGYRVLPGAWVSDLSWPELDEVWLDRQHFASLETRVARLRQWIADMQMSDLLYAHVDFPHHPFAALPSGHIYFALDNFPVPGAAGRIDGIYSSAYERHAGLRTRYRWVNEWAAMQGMQRHLLSVAYVDRLFGAMLDDLMNSPLYDEMMIVVTSDHGMRFESDRDARAIDLPWNASNDAIAFVPLFIKYPGQRQGRVFHDPASVLDVFPTMHAVMGGANVDAALVDGHSLRDLPQSRDRYMVQATLRPRVLERADVSLNSLREVAAKRHRWFDFSLDDAHTFFALDRVRHVRGRPLSDFRVHDATREYMAALFFTGQPRVVSGSAALFESEETHARIKGELLSQESLDDGAVILLAHNGRIVGSTETVADNGHGRMMFSLMIPETTFVRGENNFEVFVYRDEQTLLRTSLRYQLFDPSD